MISKVGKTLHHFLTALAFNDSPILKLGYRFLALSTFKSVIKKPTNATWILLFLDLLISVANILLRVECGNGKVKTRKEGSLLVRWMQKG
jgi:hypothetical protein